MKTSKHSFYVGYHDIRFFLNLNSTLTKLLIKSGPCNSLSFSDIACVLALKSNTTLIATYLQLKYNCVVCTLHTAHWRNGFPREQPQHSQLPSIRTFSHSISHIAQGWQVIFSYDHLDASMLLFVNCGSFSFHRSPTR